MTRSETVQQQNCQHSYTHKKFGYVHKKLGRCFPQPETDAGENILPETKEPETAKHSKEIFRPYALAESIRPRKRKISKPIDEESPPEITKTVAAKTKYASCNMAEEQSFSQSYNNPLNSCAAASSPLTTSSSTQSHYSPALSSNLSDAHLQRQMAALHLRFMGHIPSGYLAANQQTATNYLFANPYVIVPTIFNRY